MHERNPSATVHNRVDSKAPDLQAVLECADRLRRTQAGTPRPLLKSRNLGLLYANSQAQNLETFRDVATDMGANVALLASDLASTSPAQTIDDTARLLSRLYDAVTCDGLPDDVVDRLAQVASIPVTRGHIAAVAQADALAALPGGTDTPQDKRRSVLQALVMLSMG